MKFTEVESGLKIGGLAVIAIVLIYVVYKITHWSFPDITDMWRSFSREKSLEAGAILESKSIQDYVDEGTTGQDLITIQAGVGAGTVAPLNAILVQGKTYSMGTVGIAASQSVVERTPENNYGMIGASGIENVGTPPLPRYDIINQAWE